MILPASAPYIPKVNCIKPSRTLNQLGGQKMNDKFNTIMPETTDRELCIMVDRPMSADGYKNNFLPRIQEMLAKHGELRILAYFKKYQGWEQEAATMDFAATPVIATKLRRCALVNPPESMLLATALKRPLTLGETKVFTEEELPQALAWIKED